MPADSPDLPTGVAITYARQYRRCGKPGCTLCADGAAGHGPYWYAYWREAGRTRSRYLGKHPPKGANPEAMSADVVPDVGDDAPAIGPEPVSAPALRVRTLGGFALWRGDTPIPVERWARHRSAALFKWLLAAPGHRLTRDQAIELLWPDAEPDAGAANLRVLIHRLRRVLGGTPGDRDGLVSYDGEIVALMSAVGGDPDAEWLDAAAFARAAGAALAGRDASACRAALACYGGDYLPDDAYEEWAVGRREELRQQRLALLLHLADLHAGASAPLEAERSLREALTIDPCQESAARALMRLQSQHGRRTEALHTYRRLADALRRDLDLDPEPETRRLYRALQQGRPVERGDAPDATVQPPLDLPAAATPLLAQEESLSVLYGAVDATAAGQGGLILLHGSAGAGKSRLVGEALQHARQHGALALLGRAYRQEGQLPYGPLQEALRAYVAAQPSAALAAYAAYYAVLARLLPELTRLLPDLPAPATLEPRAERHRLFAALASLLGDLSARKPIVLALEDVHWADATTLQALHYVQRTCRGARLLTIVTYRDDARPDGPLAEFVDGMRDAPATTVLEVAPLDREATQALVAALLAGRPVDGGVVKLVYARARGNPLYSVEIVAALRAEGRLTERDGVWHLVGSGPLPVPASIGAATADRVRRLPAAGRDAVRLCAVLGGELAYPVLRSASDADEGTLLDGLEDALHAGLLEETAQGYTFRHPLLSEAIYREMPVRRRSLLHDRAAAALETHYAERADIYAAELAWHFGQASRHVEAARYEQRAGDRAAAAYATREAIAHYLRAQEHLDALPASDVPDTLGPASSLDEKLGDLYLREGDYARARERYARARSGPPTHAADLWRKESVTWEKQAEYERALAALDSAEEGCAGALPASVQAALYAGRGEVLYRQGRLAEATVAAERALALLRDAPEGPALAHAYHLLGHIAGDGGELGRAGDNYRRSLDVWERCGDQQGIATAWNSLGVLAFDRGEYAEAADCYNRSLAIRERIGDQSGIGIARNNLANLAWKRGDRAAALECYQSNAGLWERLGEQRHAAITWNNLGVLAFDGCAFDRAEQYHRRGLDMRERIGDGVDQGVSWVNLGDVALARGELASAECCYRTGERLFADAGLHLYTGFPWIGLGEIAAQRGDVAGATRWHRRARRLARRNSSPDVEALAVVAQARAHLRHAHPSPRRLRAVAALLERGRALAAEHDLPDVAVQTTLLEAELHLRRNDVAGARPAACAALELARRGERRRDEALARLLLGRCALAEGSPDEAEAHVRHALESLDAMGATLDAACCRVALAEAIIARANSSRDAIPAAAQALLDQAGDVFTQHGIATAYTAAMRDSLGY